MPALRPTDIYGTIRWLGYVPDRGASLVSVPVERMELGFGGMADEAHQGLTRPSCSRVLSQHRRGTEIANVRQLSVVSREDLEQIAETMGLARFDPAWLGASLVLDGIADFTLVPPSSRLQSENGTTLVIDMENRPCHLPAARIERDHPGKGRLFKQAALRRRGVTAWVERPGPLAIGDICRLHVPDQPPWPQYSRVPV